MPEQYELNTRPSAASSHRSSMEDETVQYSTSRRSGAGSSNGNDELQSENALNRRVVRKLDFILLPFLCLFFLVNSLDRSNVGNAESGDFSADIGLAPGTLNTAVSLFFVVFVALQPVGAMLGRRFGMVRCVPSAMIIWGICTALHVWVQAAWQLYLLRVVIGILEAGFYPVTVAYMSIFYTRFEFAKRLAFFYGQYAIAGALGGTLAYVVFNAFPSGQDTPPSSWRGWQVLFILEGGVTILIALVGYVWLPHGPGSAWFLTPLERSWADKRILRDRGIMSAADDKDDLLEEDTVASHRRDSEQRDHEDGSEQLHLLHERVHSSPNSASLTQDQGLTAFDVLSAVADWKVWFLLLLNMLSAIPATAFSFFLPLVVQGLGLGSAQANLLTAPLFLAGALMLWLFTWWSDQRQDRIIPILYGLAIMLAGLTATVMLPHEPFWIWPRYFALFVLLGGSFIASPLTIAWFTGNIQAPGKRSVVLGINGWGNLSGVFASLIFDPGFGPDYVAPFFITLALAMASFVGFMMFRQLLVMENSRRRALLAQWSEDEVAAEAKWGTGPALPGGLLQSRFVRQFHNLDFGSERHGEDRITVEYGL